MIVQRLHLSVPQKAARIVEKEKNNDLVIMHTSIETLLFENQTGPGLQNALGC